MPNPTPTQEEMHWARQYADAWCDAEDSRYRNLARGFHHLAAELARAEERIRYLKDGLFNAGLGRKVQELCPGAHRIICAALEQDDKLARGEEETKMKCDNPDCPEKCAWHGPALPKAPKFTPKPGDRVVLVSSPNYPNGSERIGRTFLRLPIERDASFVPYWDSEEEEVVRISRDAVFAPAPAQAEVTTEARLNIATQAEQPTCPLSHVTCVSCGELMRDPLSAHKCPAEQPPAVASGVAAGEVTDEELDRIWYSEGKDVCGREDRTTVAFDKAGRRGLYNAGRASRDAEVSLITSELQLARERIADACAELRTREPSFTESHQLAEGIELLALRHAAEVADLKRELTEERVALELVKKHCTEARQELEAEKAAHEKFAKRVVAEAQKARAVPSVEDIAAVIRSVWGSHLGRGVGELPLAREIACLFASPPSSPDNTPPEPLPEVLPPTARTKYGTSIGGWVLRRSIEPDDGFLYLPASGSPPRHCMPDQVDWAHWRSQQNQEAPEIPSSPGVPGESAANSAPVTSAAGHDPDADREQALAIARSALTLNPDGPAGTQRLRELILVSRVWLSEIGCGPADGPPPPVEQPGDASLSTDRARLEAEGWCFEEVGDIGEIGQDHDLLLDDQRVIQLPYSGNQWWGLQERTMPPGGSVLAWRRAKPIAPSPDAGIEAVKAEVEELRETVERHEAARDPVVAHYREVNSKIADVLEGLAKGGDLLKRLDELELQGRVLREYVYEQGHYRKWVRLEDKERERARKP